ncbi:MAG: hypothetical protein OEZ06_26620 [Myxococcales bacterium]|nr:hypothetical protein [Myxococcales bacterium]
MATACAAGQPKRSPTETVSTFIEVMDRSAADQNALREAFELLDREARQGLEARAHRATTLASRPFEPHEMLAQGRFRLRFAPRRVGGMRQRIEGHHAVVEAVGTGDAERAEIPLVLEEGRWRIKLRLPPMHGGAQDIDSEPANAIETTEATDR